VGGNTGKTACIPSYSENVKKENSSVTIFPNPSEGHFDIHGHFQNKWQVYNAAGNHLFSGKSASINLSAYPQGLYFVKIDGMNIKLLKK